MAKRPGNHDDDVDLSTYASSNRVDKTHPAHPAFLAKLSEILDAPDGEVRPFPTSFRGLEMQHSHVQSIRWSDSGETFVVADPVLFAKIVLPKYFKHSNFASFVRQLNLYGFYKTTADPNWCEFRNEHFRRDQRDLMKHIKRKSGPERCTTRNNILGGIEVHSPPSSGMPTVSSAGSKAVLAMDEQQTAPNSGGSSSDSVASELCMLKRKQKVVEHTLMTVRRAAPHRANSFARLLGVVVVPVELHAVQFWRLIHRFIVRRRCCRSDVSVRMSCCGYTAPVPAQARVRGAVVGAPSLSSASRPNPKRT